jgi:hypothetical protein
MDSEKGGLDIPAYRRPKQHHIENIYPALRRRDRVAKRSFDSLEIIARRNRKVVFQ